MKRVIITVAVLLVAALGTGAGLLFSHSTRKATTKVGLCADLAAIRAASVDRLGSIPGKKRLFAFPAQISIGSAARAQALAAAVCGLPRFPAGVRHCPADFGLSYVVRFSGWKGRVSIDPSGCEAVTGAGPARWATLSPGFWGKLGRALGLRHATNATFRGRAP